MRKKVLIISHAPVVPFIDINEQYAAAFPKADYSVTITYLTGEIKENEKPLVCDQFFSFKFTKKQLRGLKINAIAILMQHCRKEHYDVVICHRYKACYVMQWVALFVRIPRIIFVMHALKTMHSVGRRCLTTLLHQSSMRYAGVSNAVRDDLRQSLRRIAPDQIVTLYNVIDIPATDALLFSTIEARTKLALPDTFIIGHLGRLEANKDQKTLLHAFALLHQHYPATHLVIMGAGVLAVDLQSLAKQLNIDHAVTFTGHVNEGFRYMRAFDVFTLSSKQEAFGRVLLEAMVAEIPVVATRAFGIPEVIGDAGIIVAAEDASALRNGLEKIVMMTRTERITLGNTGRKRAISSFSPSAFHKQLAELLPNYVFS